MLARLQQYLLVLCFTLSTLIISTSLAAPNTKNPEKQNEKGKSSMVLLKTNLGDIKIKLNKEAAPETVQNFLDYVKAGFYNGTLFHRVIPNFMIQGGGFDEKMDQKKTRDPIKNEAANGLKNNRGTIAMARTNDPNSATAQFFINVKDNSFLNHQSKTPQGYGYAVFGEVESGMDIADKISIANTGNKYGMQDVPVTPIIIKEAIIIE